MQFGQTPTAPPLIRTSSRLILLDVVVTDKGGHPLRDLPRDAFTVFENGVPQKILSFEAAGSGPSAQKREAPRTIILLDQLNIAFHDLAYARDRIVLYLNQHPAENNLTSLMAIGPRGLSVAEGFTSDTALLKDRLVHLPIVNANPKGEVDQDWAQEHAQTALTSLMQIARSSVGAPYNLNVIWVTSGFSGMLQPQNRDDRLESGLRGIANLLIRSRMRLYTIDPSGVIPMAPPSEAGATSRGDIHDGHESSAAQVIGSTHGEQLSADQLLSRITRMTGGLSYFGRNDVEFALSQAVSDGSSSYLISYAPANSEFNGEYRKIEVRAAVEGSTARTRQGYYATPEEAAPKPEVTGARLDAALSSPLSYDALTVECPASYDAATGHLTGKVTVKPNPLSSGASETQQTIRMMSFGKEKKQLDSWAWNVNWKDPWTNRVVSASFNRPLSTKPRVVRFLVSDSKAERMGTCDIQIP